jgi:hypothetical protein
VLYVLYIEYIGTDVVIPKCIVFIDVLHETSSYYTEEGCFSKEKRIQYVSMSDILSWSFKLYAVPDGALHHPTSPLQGVNLNVAVTEECGT